MKILSALLLAGVLVSCNEGITDSSLTMNKEKWDQSNGELEGILVSDRFYCTYSKDAKSGKKTEDDILDPNKEVKRVLIATEGEIKVLDYLTHSEDVQEYTQIAERDMTYATWVKSKKSKDNTTRVMMKFSGSSTDSGIDGSQAMAKDSLSPSFQREFLNISSDETVFYDLRKVTTKEETEEFQMTLSNEEVNKTVCGHNGTLVEVYTRSDLKSIFSDEESVDEETKEVQEETEVIETTEEEGL